MAEQEFEGLQDLREYPVAEAEAEAARDSLRYDVRILQSVRRIIRGLDIYSRKLAAEYGITGPQLACVRTVVQHGQLTQLELSEKVHLSASTIVGILDRLEQKQLVRRERDTRDRRRINVSATDQGRALVARAPSPLDEALPKALEGLGELEKATIALSLERLVDFLDIRRFTTPGT